MPASSPSSALPIAVIGAGLIGRAWSIVFARAGHPVALYDADAAALPRCHAGIAAALDELRSAGLLREEPATVAARIRSADSMADAVSDAVYVQENVAETLDIKRAVHLELDRLAAPTAVLASSTSTIPASQWSRDVPGRARCLVAHPVNPPHVVPVVELAPAPWTAPEAVERAKALQAAAGQVPVVLLKEVPGFIVNRLQAVLLQEAFRLYAEGCMSVDDIDKTIRDGLGLRWSFMGPFETIDLNAPAGVADYCARYGAPYHAMTRGTLPREWDAELVARVEAERRALLPAEGLSPRAQWRDRRLMQLVAHRRDADAA